MSWQVVLARVRIPLVVVSLVVLVAGSALGLPWIVTFAQLLVVYWVVLRVGTIRREPIATSPPVAGRWTAINSPADHVPSHGLQMYGQAYAIDLVHEPDDRARPGFGWWPLARRSTDFPAFGAPVHAPIDGVVVRVHSRERDHWSRSSWLALPYMIVEGFFRELTGPGRVLGNHVVIDAGDGVYAVVAHLKQRSARVAKGDHVRAGDHVGDCGNSGNTSEPHLHVQLMDHRNVLVAAGLPMSFDYVVDGTAHEGLPSKVAPFEAEPALPG
jgi:murein DD-endopeptidase MepM/ murein hydrolase activator NlpD